MPLIYKVLFTTSSVRYKVTCDFVFNINNTWDQYVGLGAV